MGLLDSVSGALAGAGGASIRTRFSPSVQLAGGAGQGGGPSGALRELAGAIVQPEVSVAGVTYAPWGRPGDQWLLWWGAAGLALFLVGRRLLRR